MAANFIDEIKNPIAHAKSEIALEPKCDLQSNHEKGTIFFEKLFALVCFLATVIPLAILAWLIFNTALSGIARLDWQFISGYPSRFFEKAGILPALVGTFYLMVLTAAIALPLGIAAAVYLEEYSKESWLKKFIELNVSNIAGVPSVIFGLLGLEIFVRLCHLGSSLIAGALTLSLLILPVIITASREALKSVPNNLREAGYALGASRLSVIVQVVLPLSISQIITGAILSISRAVGESAPLIVIGAATYLAYAPNNLLGDFSALPLQIFHWVQRPQKGFVDNAAAAIIVLLIMLAFFNGLAAWLRYRQEKKRGVS